MRPKAPVRILKIVAITLSSIHPGTTRKHFAIGPVHVSLRKLSGNTRLAADFCKRPIHGAISYGLGASIAATFGKVNFQVAIPAMMVTPGLARWTHFFQMGLDYILSPAIHGSGVRIGSIRSFIELRTL